ncbi:unnamed protein product [Vicia faba]|uniref:TIR domain-containing protein n=1 Tax=Vicia faba TaxID=3906 RepID=A0AAV1AV65_VICFA|nr:unnamed protein product [Vicia faba]
MHVCIHMITMVIHGWNYDVFLSFRGEDTRTSFTGSLYHGLHQKGINVFIDDEKLRRGEQISPSLITAIEESRISIIVFSENYASSTWCLDELAMILECWKTKGQLVFPVFYYVDPSWIRHQRGSFGVAMAKHEVSFKGDVQRLNKWKKALFDAANLSGWSLKNGQGYEYELILRIIDEVCSKLNNTLLHISEHPVGLETRISEVKSLLQFEKPVEEVCFFGIHGHGGIGKTTIARALYNSIANEFEVTSFLTDIRESSTQRQGLVQLQETLLYETVGEKNIKLGNVYKGIPIIKKRLCCKKVLLILDDVDKLEQLQALAGGRDWFGFGSVIIITTRDKQLLASHLVDKTYEVKKLNHEEAFELFTWNAFKRKASDKEYMEISNNVVLYAEGLPLALKVMGSNLFGKTVEEWKSALAKYEKIPNKEVQNVLRVTFDNLEENEKEIFLDIACFFKGETVEYVEKTLQACGFFPKFGISVLTDRSLVSIDEYNRLRMHDLIQDMGREVVREVSPLEPGKRSRLWNHEDVIEVLTESSGTYRIQGMMVDLPDQYMVHLKDDSFKKMKNLKILIVRNGQFYGSPQHLPNNLRMLDWMEYPSSSLPPTFQPKKLVALNLSRSRFTLQEPFKHFDSLTSMDLSHCEFLTKLPDVSSVPNLTELNLDYCTNLEKIDDSLGFLENLTELRAYGCTKLKDFPQAIKLTSLKTLILNWCSSLQTFPTILAKMENLISISIEGTGIEELPPSIGNLVALEELSMTSCLRLKELPENIDMLQNLRNLDIEGCPQLRSFLTKLRELGKSTLTFGNVQSLNLENCGLIDEDLPIVFKCFPNLSSLVLSGNNFLTLPRCIQEYDSLQMLHLDDCKELREIPCIPPNSRYINARNCKSLTAESSNLLLSQETFEACELQIMVPGARIPEWFDHIREGEYMTFLVHEKFPPIILCFALAIESEMKKSFSCEIRFYINGEEVYELEIPRSFSEMVTDHVWLFDLRTHPSFEFHDLESYLVEDWNQIEISCVKINESPNVNISWCGVHICRQEANMEDIIFKDPDVDLDSDHEAKDDEDMEAFYAILDAENSDNKVVCESSNRTKPSEETKKVLKTLHDYLTKDFSVLLRPNEYNTMKSTLDYLTNLPTEERISVEIRSLVIEVSRQFTCWSYDYTNESKKIESTKAKLLKRDELEEGLEANKSLFREVKCLENELFNELEYLEERKKELEELINGVRANITASQEAKNMVAHTKREIFEKAKILKVQRDELKEQVHCLRDEHELAKKSQANIRDEWLKLGEKFNNTIKNEK